jgi:hypothetical protein
MKRLALAVGAALALTLLPSVTPWMTEAASGAYFSATGGGAGPCEPSPTSFSDGGVAEAGICYGGPNGEHFAFSAHLPAGSLPSAATGHVALWFVDNGGDKVARLDGPVTCLETGGAATAYITFLATQTAGFGAAYSGQHLTMSVFDGSSSGMKDTFSPPSNNGASVCGTSDTPREPVNFGQIRVDPQGVLPCVAMTDNATYNVTSSCDVYYNDGSGWQLAP